MTAIDIRGRLEAALVRGQFSKRLQALLFDLRLDLSDNVLDIDFDTPGDRLSPEAGEIYSLLIKEIRADPDLKKQIREIWFSCRKSLRQPYDHEI